MLTKPNKKKVSSGTGIDFSSAFDDAVSTSETQVAEPEKKTNGFDFSKAFDQAVKKKGGTDNSTSGLPQSTSQLPLQENNAQSDIPETIRVVRNRVEDHSRKEKPSIDNNFGLATPQELAEGQRSMVDSRPNTVKESINNFYTHLDKDKVTVKSDSKPISLLDAHQRDKEQGKAVGSNIWNKFLTGIGELSSGVSDLMFQGLRKILPSEGISDEEALKKFREEGEPTLRTATKELLGAKVTPQQEKNFNDNFWTSAVGGLAASVPAMAGTKGSGLILQAYDNGLETINSTEEGKKLPENTKTVFGIGVGVANGVLEKVGLDKIFGKESNKVATRLAVSTFKELLDKSKVPITSEIFEQALTTAGRDIKKKIIDAGGRIGKAGLVEFATGAAQESANVLAEEIVNKTQDKDIFEPTSWGDKMSRILKAGAQEAVGGGLLGAASIPFSTTRNYIAEKVSDAKSVEDIDNLKTELATAAANQQLPPEDVEQINKTIDDYVRVNQKIPTDIENKKDVADKILDREAIHDEIDAKEKEIVNVDDAFKENLRTEIAALRNRAQEINEEINPQIKIEQNENSKESNGNGQEASTQENVSTGEKVRQDVVDNGAVTSDEAAPLNETVPEEKQSSITVIQPEDNTKPNIVENVTENNVVEPVSSGGDNIKPPSVDADKLNGNEGDGKEQLKEMALNIPNDGQLKEYASKGTIEKYHGETPENDQGIVVQELRPALQHGEDMIDKAKEIYGDKDYVDKTLQFIEESKVPTQSKALMYISLENDLARQKLNDPANLDIQKKQDLVRSKSQAFLREASLAINFGKLRKIGEVGYDISKITDNFFSSKEKEDKNKVEKSIEADADTINKEAENLESAGMDLEQKINEGVESAISKIHEKLPPELKRKSDKAIEALEKFQKKIRSKTYDATIGVPAAIVDAGITVIKQAIKAGVRIADAIELGIQHIKDKYGKEWAKEGDFRSDMLEGFREQGIKKEAEGTPSKIIKDALIEAGYGREINIKTKDGKEKRNIIDWKKLAGAEGSVERMKENVSNVLDKQGYSKEEISDIQKDLSDQYDTLRASVIKKSINELNKRNQKTISPDQKAAAKKLAELYNYGLFDKDPAQYDVLLANAIGIDRLSPERFKQAHELGKALETLYSSKFNGKKLNDLELKTALQVIEEKMRVILHAEAGQHGSSALKLADIVRTYMDATQRMVLNSLGQAVQNPLSGLEQTLISNVDRMFDNSSTKELRQQKRKVAASVYKDMVLSGGVNYGDVNTQFVSRGSLDAHIAKMSDSKIVQAIASTAIGKTTLDAADSFYKTKLTEQKFTYNLIKILTQNRLVDGKMVEGMKKEDAVNYVSEKLTGQSFKDAQKTAKEIIDKVNSGDKKIVGDSYAFVDRLANDIVKAALINGKVITSDQVTHAYNAAYKSAGRSLGHVANNPISEMVQGLSGKIEKKINDAIKDKEYKKAAFLTYQSIFFRNVMNPFVGGGTNWVVLKLEKNGLGLVSGLYNSGKTKLDLTSESGLRKVEQSLYEEARDRDAFMRGAIGGATSLLTAMLWFGVSNTDEYRKWRNKHMWAAKYLDNITPEEVLATMAARNKELGYYMKTLFNKNDAYDKAPKIIKGVDKIVKGLTGSGGKAHKNLSEGIGNIGEVVGGSFGFPLPWRLVRDGQNIWLGATGQQPYKVSSDKPQGFWEGALKAGMIDYIKNNPAHKK